MRCFGSGTLGLALGGRSIGLAVTGTALGSRRMEKNGLFRTAGPAKVALVKGADRQEMRCDALKRWKFSACRRSSAGTVSRHTRN